MIKCWAEKPEDRPAFSTLRQDLDDFDAIYESQYAHYELPKYQKKPAGAKGGARKSNQKEAKRDQAMAGRKKRSKQ